MHKVPFHSSYIRFSPSHQLKIFIEVLPYILTWVHCLSFDLSLLILGFTCLSLHCSATLSLESEINFNWNRLTSIVIVGIHDILIHTFFLCNLKIKIRRRNVKTFSYNDTSLDDIVSNVIGFQQSKQGFLKKKNK